MEKKPEPAEPELTAYSDDGVDLTLIRAFLALTPAERLEFLDDRIADLERIRARLREREHGR